MKRLLKAVNCNTFSIFNELNNHYLRLNCCQNIHLFRGLTFPTKKGCVTSAGHFSAGLVSLSHDTHIIHATSVLLLSYKDGHLQVFSQLGGNRSDSGSSKAREHWTKYFFDEGAVSFQRKAVNST